MELIILRERRARRTRAMHPRRCSGCRTVVPAKAPHTCIDILPAVA